MPRKNGLRQIACRAAIESMSCDSTYTDPLGSRTATAQ